MAYQQIEASVKSCYSTWSKTYYEDYYGTKAPYPPVHREILKKVLKESGAVKVLDAGCGPASFLRELIGAGMELYGFDLTPEMVAEARRVYAANGLPPERIWEGSVLDPASFHVPGSRKKILFDAAVCSGVLPHIPEEADVTVLENLRGAVRRGGLVIAEARNQLFSLFTLNRYSYHFFMEHLINKGGLKEKANELLPAVQGSLDAMAQHFRMDLPPVRKGKADEPGYDEVLSRTHNPLVLREQFLRLGFRDVRLLFYHYHCLPPMFESHMPELFRKESLAMEDPTDWRGYFMASAFIIEGKKA
jgi:SAM-dependent methyltransferase